MKINYLSHAVFTPILFVASWVFEAAGWSENFIGNDSVLHAGLWLAAVFVISCLLDAAWQLGTWTVPLKSLACLGVIGIFAGLALESFGVSGIEGVVDTFVCILLVSAILATGLTGYRNIRSSVDES